MTHSPPRVSSPDEIRSALLKAGREHAPTRESRTRALVGLGLATSSATVALTGSTSAGAATPVKGAIWLFGAKWVGLAAVAISAASATVIGTTRTPTSPALISASRAPATAPRPPPSASPADEIAAAREPLSMTSQAAEPALQRSKRPDSALEGARPDELGEELALLQRARSALHNGNEPTADSALRAYAQRFPAGRLRPEAMVLRIDLLVQRGEHDQARTLARRFVEAHPGSPHAVRMRTLK